MNINFISIQVKCPHCNVSLMDTEHKVDNEQSIKLVIDNNNNKGLMYLSSIYGSYNYYCNVDINLKDIVRFSCPHCKKELTTIENCNVCNAPMVTLILDIGGKVTYCSRKGCKNHNIGFDDLSAALKKFYHEFGYKDESHKIDEHSEVAHKKSKEEERKEIIETGSFLNTYCPHCKKTLIEADMLKLKVINELDEVGYALLSPYLNVFSLKSTVFLPEEKNIKDIQCFHCNESLIVPDGKCEKCGTPIAKIEISARTKMIDFYICSKKGCTWHGLNKNDIDDIQLEDSSDW